LRGKLKLFTHSTFKRHVCAFLTSSHLAVQQVIAVNLTALLLKHIYKITQLYKKTIIWTIRTSCNHVRTWKDILKMNTKKWKYTRKYRQSTIHIQQQTLGWPPSRSWNWQQQISLESAPIRIGLYLYYIYAIYFFPNLLYFNARPVSVQAGPSAASGCPLRVHPELDKASHCHRVGP